MRPTREPTISSTGRNPVRSNIRMPYVMTAVTAIPTRSGVCNRSASPIAPPRNSARSVAIAAISLTIHIAHTTGRGKFIAAHFRKVAPGDDAELCRQRLEQHRDQIGRQHHPKKLVAILGAGLDVGGEITRVDVGDRGDHGGPHEGQAGRQTAASARQHVPCSRDAACGQRTGARHSDVPRSIPVRQPVPG